MTVVPSLNLVKNDIGQTPHLLRRPSKRVRIRMRIWRVLDMTRSDPIWEVQIGVPEPLKQGFWTPSAHDGVTST